MQKKVCARLALLARGAARASFFLPFLIASIAVLGSSGSGLAQNSSVLDSLQQLQRNGNGLGGLGGLGANGLQVPYVGQQPDMGTQVYTPETRAVPLPPSRLEQIFSARAGVKLKQFGYDQLGHGRSVTVAQTGAVPDDYILGPGDQIIISLRGQESNEYRVAVDRNGQVILPRLKPIPAIGRSFGSFRQSLEAAVHSAYVATDAFVSVAAVRQISVLVSGEVNNPGQRTLSGLASIVDALLLSGGVRKTGSLRNVHVQRGGREFKVDLYSVLTTRGGKANLQLADGDRILVPPLGRTIAVSGLVRQPGIYELPSGQSSIAVRSFLQLAGGQEVRGRYRMSVMRIQAGGQTAMEALADESGLVRDSEILFVQLGADQSLGSATLAGGTGLAGQYAVQGARLSDVLRAPGAMGNHPYTLLGIIVRKDPQTLLRTLVPFSPVAVLNGTEDELLQTDDVIRILSVKEVELLRFVVRTYLAQLRFDQNRLRDPLSANANLVPEDPTAGSIVDKSQSFDPNNPALLTARGQQFEADDLGLDDFVTLPAEIKRSDIIALMNMAAPGTILAQQQTAAFIASRKSDTSNSNNASSDTPPDPRIMQQQALRAQNAPLDQQAFQINPNGQQEGSANGRVNSNPAIPVPAAQELPPNYMEEPTVAGGFASNREVQTFGQLMRQLNIDPLVLVNFLIDSRVQIDGAVGGPGTYFVGPQVPLKDLVQASGGTANWADESGVELMTTVVDRQSGRSETRRRMLPLTKGTLASYMVQPGDHLRFNRVYTDVAGGSVSVQGQVRYTGNYPITRGERLSEVLMRAGGLTTTAYPAGTVYLRKSAASSEHDGYMRAANEIQEQLIAGMARVGSDKIPPETFTAMQSFINRLRTQKAAGRVSFIADPSLLAAHPEMDPLVEPGDVVFIPQRPTTISVMGEVMQPGTYAYRPGMKVDDYVNQAGGLGQFANDDLTFVVLPDGTARKMETSLFGFDSTRLPPGSTIVVPRDLAPLTARQIVLDVSGIVSQLAISLASLAVISR